MSKAKKVTNIDGIRNASKALLFAVEIDCDNPFGIISHPFANHIFSIGENHEILNLTNEEDCKEWKNNLIKRIDDSDLARIYMMINKPWRIAWLKYVEPYMTNGDFAAYLSDAYVSEEMPNLNPNVSVKELIKWFKRADKRSLMDDDEYKFWSALSEEVTLFRGVSHDGDKRGISWTTSKETAEWFANRFANEDNPARVYKVAAPKKSCLCYFGSRGENEIILDVDAIKQNILQIV